MTPKTESHKQQGACPTGPAPCFRQGYAENGEIRIGNNFYFENDNDPSAASLDVYVSNLTFDGLQLVITLKTGESIVLTPVLEPAA